MGAYIAGLRVAASRIRCKCSSTTQRASSCSCALYTVRAHAPTSKHCKGYLVTHAALYIPAGRSLVVAALLLRCIPLTQYRHFFRNRGESFSNRIRLNFGLKAAERATIPLHLSGPSIATLDGVCAYSTLILPRRRIARDRNDWTSDRAMVQRQLLPSACLCIRK